MLMSVPDYIEHALEGTQTDEAANFLESNILG